MQRMLSVWWPGWPIHRLHRAGWPDDQALATVETLRGQLRVAECCALARGRGVTPGLPLSQARTLCPDLGVTDADPAADRAGLGRLAAWCERYTPLAAPDPPDGLWLDITGCGHLFGGEEGLARHLAGRLTVARIAVAATPGAAWALARAATRPALQVVAPGRERESLAPLPVGLLRLDPRVVASLRRVGLRSIGELARQPRADLAARFGVQPGLRLDQAFGVAAEAISWPRAPAEWSERLGFVEPIGTADDLAAALDRLGQILCARLEAAGLGGMRFTARFLRVDDAHLAHPPEITVATARPLRQPARLLRLLAAKLETVDPGLGVEAITLTADPVAPLALTQARIDGPADTTDLTTVIDDIANRLGPDRLWRPVPQASHVPERAVTAGPPLDAPAIWPMPAGERPVRLLRPPERIEAVAPVPDDPPLLFRWRGALHRVRAASGPERIAAEWWRRAPEGYRFRDYYQVEDTEGARFWLFRTGLPGDTPPPGWFLHGLFA